MDTVSREKRSEIMSRIKGTETRSELMVRKCLWRRGYRYRLHEKTIPGKPDVVLPKFRAVIFIHGCFWHRHDCKYAYMPKTNIDFWRTKFNANIDRDKNCIRLLRADGWRVCVVWECTLAKGRNLIPVVGRISKWIESSRGYLEIPKKESAHFRIDKGNGGDHKMAALQ